MSSFGIAPQTKFCTFLGAKPQQICDTYELKMIKWKVHSAGFPQFYESPIGSSDWVPWCQKGSILGLKT
jgi:hypothetical protein